MSKALSFFLFSLIITIMTLGNLHAQAPNWLFAQRAGGSSYENGNAIAFDANGNSYITGEFVGSSITFGSTILYNSGNSDIFVAKLDADGNWLWATNAEGTYDAHGYGISTDAVGNAYVIGYFSGNITFGSTTLSCSYQTDLFVAKLDANGNWIWARKAMGTGFDYGCGISVDAVGNAYVTGYFEGVSITFGGTTLTNSGNSDIFVAKLDADGYWMWAKKAGGPSNDKGMGISVDTGGNAYVTGDYYSVSITFGSTTLTNSGYTDIFVAKLDAGGNWMWAKKAGGTSDDYGCGISADADGNSYFTGFFNGNITFGSTTLTNSGGYDIFVAKLDASGNWMWAKRAGGTDLDQVFGISVDAGGNAYVTGRFASSGITFGSTTLTNSSYSNTYGYHDIFVAKLDASGNWLWAKQAGGTNYDTGSSIAVDSGGNAYVTGSFSSSNITFGNTILYNSGNHDIYVAKCGAGDTSTRITSGSFTDKTCKLGIPILLEANLQWQGLLSTWWDLNNEPVVFQIMINGIWQTIPADIMSTTSFTTGEGDNPSGTARVYYTAPANLPPGNYPIRACYNGNATYAMCISQKTLTVVKPQWLTMVYMCGDNDLEVNACEDYFSEMMQAKDNNDVSVVVLLDRHHDYYSGYDNWEETRQYYLTAEGEYYQSMGELDMGLPVTLSNFLQSATSECPAYNTALILWDHGSGICRDTTETVMNGICFDDTNGNNRLTIPEIRSVLSSYTFDILGFDACLMGMAEIVYDMKDFCTYVIASEDNETGDGWEYHNFLTPLYLGSNTTPTQMCNNIISGCNQNTLGAWRLDNGYVDLLKSAVSDLAQEFINSMQYDRTSTINFINNAIDYAADYSGTYEAYDNSLRTYIDLRLFCIYVGAYSGNPSLVTYSNQIINLLQNPNFRIYWHFNTGVYAGGLSIYFPLSQSSPTYGWSSYMPTGSVLFNNDNYWDEMLIYYFDVTPPTISISSPGSFAWYKQMITVTTNPSDPGNLYYYSGLLNVEFQYSLNGSNWYALPGPDSDNGFDWYGANGWELRFNTIGTPVHGNINDGSVWVRARAKDQAGNIGDWAVSSSFGVDNTAPSQSSSSLTPSLVEGSVSNISLTSSDALSGIAVGSPRFYYRYDNSTINDDCDNIVLTLRYDGSDFSDRLAVTSASGENADRATYTNGIQINSGSEGSTLYWKYKIQDNAGNVYWSNLYSSLIGDSDTQGPSISQLNGPYNSLPGTQQFSALITDSSGINWSGNPPRLYYRYNNSSIDLSLNDGYVNFSSSQTASLYISGSRIGDHLYWRVYAEDADYSPTSTWSSVQDAGIIQNDVPVLDISTANYQTVYAPAFLIEGTADDDWNGIELIQLSLNNGGWVNIWSGSDNDVDWDYTLTLAEGSNTIQVKAMDSEGLYSDTESLHVTYQIISLDPPSGLVITYNNQNVRL
ncbi:MAG: clostripain-related cysteine peptidase, partial [Candidatus Cloacimonadaceae bacterium]